MGLFTSIVKIAIINAFLLVASSQGQDRGGTPPGDGYMYIGGVLSRAHMSGSLEYWGVCDFKDYYPNFPKLQALTSQEVEDSPLGQLQKMFSIDPNMRVTEDDEKIIRMVETDVPSDLLDLRIPHLHFRTDYQGPNWAMQAILRAPEVMAFRREHNIGPEYDWQPGFPVTGAIPNSSVTGDLHDVTVREGLDYILKTYPGFWMYENCKTPTGGRIVYMQFVQNIPTPPTMPTLGEAPKNEASSH